eukprot:11178372-Lingulodinium_polyedra.AAC.1
MGTILRGPSFGGGEPRCGSFVPSPSARFAYCPRVSRSCCGGRRTCSGTGRGGCHCRRGAR